MQDFSNTVYVSSEQHKEETPSRIERDRTDLQKLASKFEQHSTFKERQNLRNVITGINADKDVNVQNLFAVGKNTIEEMENQSVFSYSYKRKMKVKTARAIKVSEDQAIDPALLLSPSLKNLVLMTY